MVEKKTILGRLRDQLPELPQISLPKLGREVEIPVYLIHNSADAQDYFFIFDFEQFVERSRSGMFVRPKIKIWAGRDDFEKRLFARQFRKSFSDEFEAARRALSQEKGGGWFSWLKDANLFNTSVEVFIASMVLLVATSAGKMVWNAIPFPKIPGKMSDQEKLEQSIDEIKGKVDTALESIDITLHLDLYRHAYKGGSPGRLTGLDYDAWPLPDFVLRHLTDKSSTSWW